MFTRVLAISVMTCFPWLILASNTVSVNIGGLKIDNVNPLNVPYVEYQLRRIEDIQTKVSQLKGLKSELAKKVADLNEKIENLADTLGLHNDSSIKILKAETSNLSNLIQQKELIISNLKPEAFKNYAEFAAQDQLSNELNLLKLQLAKNKKETQQKIRLLASEHIKGKALVTEVWDTEAELELTTRSASNAQSQRDKISRSCHSAINNYLEQKPAEPKQDDLPTYTVKIAPPKDAQARRNRYLQRNSTEQLHELGLRFFTQIDLSSPRLEKIKMLVEQKKYQEALDAYKGYFLTQHWAYNFTSGADGISSGGEEGISDDDDVSGEDLNPSELPPAVKIPSAQEIADAMEGTISAVLPLENKQPTQLKANLGNPGAIHWVFPDALPENTSEALCAAEVQLAQSVSLAGKFGQELLNSYVISGNHEHLKRWAEIADDWSMNWPNDVDQSRRVIRNYNMLIGYEHSSLFIHLRNCAKLNKNFIQDLPSATLARLLLTANAEYITSAIRVMRSGQYNFRIMMLTGMIPYTLNLQEFYTLRWAAREATRLTEQSMVHNLRRDGAVASLANAGHENTDGSFISLVKVMEEAKPNWISPWWTEEFTYNLCMFNRYWFHFLKQNGRAFRVSWSPLAEHFAPNSSIKTSLLQHEPEVQNRMWKVFQQAIPYGDKNEQLKIWKSAVKGVTIREPQYRSETLPYSGYSLLRSGWEKSDYLLYLHSPNQPVGSGRDDSNGYSLQKDELLYLNAPPIFIDGRIQYSGYNLAPWSGAKSIYSISAKSDLNRTTRFHSSNAFDLAEGLYDGAYIYSPEYRKSAFCDLFGTYGNEFIARRLRKEAEKTGKILDESPILDSSHTRQVLSIQGRNLYIITDFMKSSVPRTCDQNYGISTFLPNDHLEQRLALIKKGNCDPIVLDTKNNSLKVRNPGISGMDMYFFGKMPLQFNLDQPYSKIVTTKKQSKTLPATFRRSLKVSWKSDEVSSLITVVKPYQQGEAKEPDAELKNIQSIQHPKNISGFSAEFPDGTPIYYSASQQITTHTTGNISVQANNLLLVGQKGIVLGCQSITLHGKTISPTNPDFEFSLNNNLLNIDAVIHRPIKPVTLTPETTVFVDQTKVTLHCSTPDVEIRYSLDGKDVTCNSNLYHEPIALNSTTWVKARAFRKGLKETPWVEDGTHATVQSWGIFEKVNYHAATVVDHLKPGLHYEVFENLWPVLLSEGPFLPAQKSGYVNQVLDTSPHQNSNPFGIRYSGYLDIPHDGVYDFYAPPEFQFPDLESGYDLRVVVDGNEWYPTSRWHAHGTWSIALKKGLHAFKVFYADMRRKPHREELLWGFPKKDFTWQGKAPELKVSGPELMPQVIPAAWLKVNAK